MKQLIEFPLEDGTSILVEVDQPEPEGGLVKTARPGEVVARASQTLEQAMEKIKPAAAAVIKKLRGLSDPPDEISVEFGIKLSAEAGAVVASAGVEANYTVTLKWEREKKEKTQA